MDVKPFHLFLATFLLFFVLQPFVIKSLKFESVQNLNRAQKGDIISGVDQIKRYLKTYGYYSHDSKHVLDNHFDDSLESALKAYQKVSHLNVTGKIDSDTIKGMMIPRCGVPDNHLVSNYNFPGSPYKWNKFSLTYSFDTNETLAPVFANAFKSWADESKFNFKEAARGVQGDIKIGFYPTSHGDNNDFQLNEWAHAFYPQNGRVHFNADAIKTWSSNPTTDDKVDIESIAVHELGHSLGLNHSDDKDAVMYFSFPGGTFTKRALTDDDKAGIQALYK